jgi:thiosulfate/3-mercaptopyruvate sulfurtransferase
VARLARRRGRSGDPRDEGLIPEQELVLYGDGARALLDRLAVLGFSDVELYEEAGRRGRRTSASRSSSFRSTSSSSTSTGCETCSRAAAPEAPPAERHLLFHVNFGVPEEYEENHIPGALYLDTNWLEDSSDWNRRSPVRARGAVLRLGITHDTTVILYGRDTEGNANEKWPGRRAGQIAAARAALILTYSGVETSACSTADTTTGCRRGTSSRRRCGRPPP